MGPNGPTGCPEGGSRCDVSQDWHVQAKNVIKNVINFEGCVPLHAEICPKEPVIESPVFCPSNPVGQAQLDQQ